jgi:hypothetical protein
MKRPLTGLVVVYAAGIWLGSILSWPAAVLGWCVVGALALFVAAARSRFSLPALLLFVLALGSLAYRMRTTNSAATNCFPGRIKM